jgi:hypothetical protein
LISDWPFIFMITNLLFWQWRHGPSCQLFG